MSGSSLNYLIGFFIFIVATKNFSKEEIGIYSLYLSFLAIASQFTTGKIELSIPLASIEDEKKILSSTVIVSFFISLVMGIIGTYLISKKHIPFIEHLSIFNIIFILSISIFLNTLYNIMNIILTKNGKLVFFSMLLIALSILKAIGQISAIYLFKSLILFILFFAFPIIIILYFSKINFFLFTQKKKEEIFIDISYVYKKYKNKIFHIMPASILNALTVYSIPLFMGYKYSLALVGIYMLADKLISVPMRIVSTALEANFIHQISSYKNKKMSSIMSLYLFASIIIFYFIYVLIHFFIDSTLFIKIFNNDWKEIIHYIGYISIVYTFFFISSIISKVITLNETTKDILIFDIIKIVLLMLVYILTILFELTIYNFLFLYASFMAVPAIYIIYKSFVFESLK